MDKKQQLAKIAELQGLFARARENPDAWVAGMRVLDKWEIEAAREAPPAISSVASPQDQQFEEAAVEQTWLHEAAGL